MPKSPPPTISKVGTRIWSRTWPARPGQPPRETIAWGPLAKPGGRHKRCRCSRPGPKHAEWKLCGHRLPVEPCDGIDQALLNTSARSSSSSAVKRSNSRLLTAAVEIEAFSHLHGLKRLEQPPGANTINPCAPSGMHKVTASPMGGAHTSTEDFVLRRLSRCACAVIALCLSHRAETISRGQTNGNRFSAALTHINAAWRWLL